MPIKQFQGYAQNVNQVAYRNELGIRFRGWEFQLADETSTHVRNARLVAPRITGQISDGYEYRANGTYTSDNLLIVDWAEDFSTQSAVRVGGRRPAGMKHPVVWTGVAQNAKTYEESTGSDPDIIVYDFVLENGSITAVEMFGQEPIGQIVDGRTYEVGGWSFEGLIFGATAKDVVTGVSVRFLDTSLTDS